MSTSRCSCISRCLAVACLVIGGLTHASAAVYRYEAEAGTRSGTNVASSVGGFSGTGYVTGFDNDNDRVSWSVNVPGGLYDVYLGYRSQFGDKGYSLHVGPSSTQGTFTQSSTWAQEYAGQFYLDTPTTPFAVQKNWGYYDVDFVELRSTTPRAPMPVAPTLANPNASPNTRYLMNYLASNYGQRTLYGQQREFSNPSAILSPTYLNHVGGVFPAMIGSDLMEYSPSRSTRYDQRNGETERMINWARQTGGVVNLMWHWNAPSGLIDQPGKEWWRGFYTDSTTFNLGAALANPQSADYGLLIRDIDVIATELKKYQAADVPVLWRPLHEAQGNSSGAWFWWGASGAEPLKELWGLMYDRLTNHHGLDNLIWVSTQQVGEANWQNWYPGDAVVDVVGADVYSSAGDYMTGKWLELLDEYDGEKLLALSETGTLPPVDAMERYGVAWSYMVPWSESFLTSSSTAAQAQAILGDDDVVALSELPVTPWRVVNSIAGDFSGDGQVTSADYQVWRDHYGLGGSSPADANDDGRVDAADYTVWRDAMTAASTSVPEPGAATLLLAGIAPFCRRRKN
ncbi:MAG: glycosyl hydrolase [Lacipirellulaceae bacterium]